jgi:hypothetical protein
MIDLSAEKGYLSTSLNIIYLTQMIIQGVWFTESPLVNGNIIVSFISSAIF